MALLSRRPIRVEPFFGYRSRDRLMLSARALRSRTPKFDPRPRLKAMRTILSQFASREVAGLAVRLTMRGPHGRIVECDAVTNSEGYVHFDLALDPPMDLPPHPEWESAMLSWHNRDGRQTITAQVMVPGRDSKLAVISDIDDTIIETGITGGWYNVVRNWRRLFAQLPHERTMVPHAKAFYGELAGGTDRLDVGARAHLSRPATKRPFFYVSSSPWNLFNYLVAFKRAKGLPVGPLLLRDWGFNRATLGSASHGAHKRLAIDAILAMYPEMRFALIGDDTQGDLPAFARTVERNPGRVTGVFLRTVVRQSFTPQESAFKLTIEQSGVPLWFGDTYSVGLDFLHSQGFTPGGETEQIVRAVEGELEGARGGTNDIASKGANDVANKGATKGKGDGISETAT